MGSNQRLELHSCPLNSFPLPTDASFVGLAFYGVHLVFPFEPDLLRLAE